MCPHMNFAIAMSVAYPLDEMRVKESFEKLAQCHPFLKSVLGHDEKSNSYFYDVTDNSRIEVSINKESLSGADDQRLIDEYKSLTGYDWDIRKEGLLKAAVWGAQDKSEFLLVFHHLLTDGRGALGLAQELADLYAGGKEPEFAEEKLIASAQDLPKESRMSFVSRLLVKRANRGWDKEGREPLSYQAYHDYADEFVKIDPVSIEVVRTSPEDVEKMAGECKDHSVTVNDYLMARMFADDKTNKIIIAKDLRESLPFYNKGALGNYSTAFSILVKDRGKDIWSLAKEVHEKVLKAIADPKALFLVLQCYASLKPEVLDAAFMAAKGSFTSKSAEFIGKMFFGFGEAKGYSITNLGKIESSSIASAFFIPPASPAIKKTVGVLTVNGEMITCTCAR